MSTTPTAPARSGSAPTPSAGPHRSAGPAQARLPFVFYVLGAGTFLMGTTEFIVAGLLPELAADFGTTEARDAIDRFDIVEINRLKAVSRVGMGRCQGRICSGAAAELLAAQTGRSLETVGRLRAQAPLKPVPLVLAHASRETEAAE